MKKIFLLFFLISACASNDSYKKKDIPNIVFSNNLTIEQFKNNLEVYANNAPYPNIDN